MREMAIELQGLFTLLERMANAVFVSGAFGSGHALPPHSAPVMPLPSVDGVDAIDGGQLDVSFAPDGQ